MVEQQKILVLEDEKNVGSTLVERLKEEGYNVTWSTTVDSAKLEINSRNFDLALLDVGLPDGNGYDIAAQLRENQKSTAIIFLTAYGNPEDRIKGLELGAEDYIVKPFHLKELILRIQNGLKRAKYFKNLSASHEDQISLGKAKITFSRFEIESDGKLNTLSHKECALLKFLYEKKNTAVSRDDILNHVWSEDEFPTTRTIDNFILKLRRLIEVDHENPHVIKSIRGVGYLIQTEERS